MKKSVFVYGSLLAALLAEGADLTRAQIDAKLAELAKSKPPTKLSPGATCYAPLPMQQRPEFVCPKCSQRTILPRDTFYHILRLREQLNANLPALRKLELDISLDETSLCSACHDQRYLKETFHLKKTPTNMTFQIGYGPDAPKIKAILDMKIEIIPNWDLTGWEFVPELWTKAKNVNDKRLLKNSPLHTGPGEKYPLVITWKNDDSLRNNRDRVEKSVNGWIKVLPYEIRPVEAPEQATQKMPPLPALEWVIKVGGQTRRVKAQKFDDQLLIAFLTGKDRYTVDGGREMSVKSATPRLRALLGAIK